MDPDTPIDLTQLSELYKFGLWDIHVSELPAEIVLRLYENRWRYLDPDQMGQHEREILETLIAQIGNGVFRPR